MAMAAPAAASAGRAAAGKTAGKAAAGSSGGAAGSARKTAAGGGAAGSAGAPDRGSWRQQAQQGGGGKPAARGGGAGARLLRGDAGRYRRMMIAEFIVCVVLLGLSPLAVKNGEMGPIRFMKKGSATCGLFVVLGLVSSAGRGAAKAAAMFGALVTLVLLVDQRGAFGKLSTILTMTDEDKAADAVAASAGDGPDASTDADDEPESAQV